MIKRREFGVSLVGMTSPGITWNSLAAAQKPRKNTLMHVGGDYHSVAGRRHHLKTEPSSTTCATE